MGRSFTEILQDAARRWRGAAVNLPASMEEALWSESRFHRAQREFESVFLGLRGFLWTCVWTAVGIATTIYLSSGHSLWVQVALGVGLFIAGLAIAGITTFGALWMRAVVRQRDEARAGVAELTQPFPNVLIEIDRLREDWQDQAGTRLDEPRTYRAWFPVVVTNREQERRVSLRFYLTINSPDGSGVLVTHFPTEQEEELPLLVDPQDSKRIELSVFANDYLTARMLEETRSGRHEINGANLLYLNVFDLLSEKEIDMRVPSTYRR